LHVSTGADFFFIAEESVFMKKIITAADMRRCEAVNFAQGTADALQLMQCAGNGCAEELLKIAPCWGEFKRLVIFVGSGNNGGDGVVMASYLAGRINCEILLALAMPEKLSDAARYYLERLESGVTVTAADQLELQQSDVVVDGLLGSGCHGVMREPLAGLIKRINASGCRVFALDMPSGLGSDLTIRADFTAVIGFFKRELFTAAGIAGSGIMRLVPLELPIAPEVAEDVPLAADLNFFRQYEQPLERNTHKYRRGSVLIAGGSAEYFQAPFLSGRAALRSGAGLVRLALPFAAAAGCGTLALIPGQVRSAGGSLCAESFSDLEPYLNKINVIAVGPGMGRSADAGKFIGELLSVNKPLLLDADALFAAGSMQNQIRRRNAPTLLTPHRGEAENLAAAIKRTLPADDLSAAKLLAEEFNATVLLKGARTVIADPSGKSIINTSGTPALATAGSGDVLTGAIAAEMCRFSALTAAARGAFMHGLAGELLEQYYSESGVIADDLPEALAAVRQRLRRSGDIFAEKFLRNNFKFAEI